VNDELKGYGRKRSWRIKDMVRIRETSEITAVFESVSKPEIS
jgi:hypothetical protein